MSARIPLILKDRMHFLTFSVRHLYYIFDRHERFKILENSFIYCQKNELKFFAFVFMLNHLHFIAQAPDLIKVINSMKSFLSFELQRNILATEPDIIKLFKAGDRQYNFWQDKNYPEMIESDSFYEQKCNYIIYNPVRKGYVHEPEDWYWSSVSKVPTKIQISNQ